MNDAATEDAGPRATPGHEVRKEKMAATTAPLDESIRKRWSPRAFSDRRVTDHDLRTVLEAARWAPSSYNEQPWRFLIARREERQATPRPRGPASMRLS